MFYTYILFSIKYREFYIGYSSDLKRRLKQHLADQVQSTKNREMVLVFYEAFKSEADARRREQYLKTTKGKKTLKLMLKDSLKEIVNIGPIV